MLKKIFSTPEHSTLGDLALFLTRLVCGIAFMYHGWGKIQNPFGWLTEAMGGEAFAPGIFQALAALSEFGGGLAWVLGLVTPLGSLGIGCTMIVAVYFHAVLVGDPFVSNQAGAGSYEPAAVYLCIAWLMIAMGPGRYSLDKFCFGLRAPKKQESIAEATG